MTIRFGPDGDDALDPQPLDPSLLDRYWHGETSPDEMLALDAWRATYPEQWTRYEQLYHGLSGRARVAVDLGDVNRTIAAVMAHTISAQNGESRQRSERSSAWLSQNSRKRRVHGVMTACAAVALVGASAWLFGTRKTSAPTQRYQTASGQRSTVRLADGSTMMLAPATSVILSPSTIDVNGEAYFVIAPHTSRAVIVRTRNSIVRVLGTRFLVRQYSGETDGRVVVEDGRVALQLRTQHPSLRTSTVLSARMLAQITDSGVTITRGIVARDYTGWTRGTLVFDKVSLRDVVAELSRAYGAQIRVDDSVLAGKSMIFEVSVSQEPLAQVLDMLGQLIDAKYAYDGQSYVLVPGYRTRQSPQRTRSPQPETQYGR